MIIKSIRLVNFRNHARYEGRYDEQVSLILGENGWGKTSILEAMYILMRGKSFRAVDKEILRRGADFYRIELEYYNGEVVRATFDGVVKTFLAEGKKTRRLAKKNRYPVVLFLPADLNLVGTGPGRRRDYFDRMFGQLDEGYSNSLARYEKALRQRNELLKVGGLEAGDVFSWNVLLAKYGVEVSKKRREFLALVNLRFGEVYASIAENEDGVELILETQVENREGGEGWYLKRLEEEFGRDSYVGYTGFGVHRDDFLFNFRGEKAEGSASRGEVRSMILALKFIEAEMIFERLGVRPVVLLDDVFSELDEKRQKCLVKNFKDNQVIITSANGLSY